MCKLVTANWRGPYNGGIKYTLGTLVEVANANCDETRQCAEGVSLADLPWCMGEWRSGCRILLCEFECPDDIAAIPFGTSGQFRVHRCTPVAEVDLAEIGLIDEAVTNGG